MMTSYCSVRRTSDITTVKKSMSPRQVGNATLTVSGFESVTKFARLHHRGEWSDSEIILLTIGIAVISRGLTNYGSIAAKQRRIALLQGTESRKCVFVASVPREPNDSQPTKGFIIRVL